MIEIKNILTILVLLTRQQNSKDSVNLGNGELFQWVYYGHKEAESTLNGYTLLGTSANSTVKCGL